MRRIAQICLATGVLAACSAQPTNESETAGEGPTVAEPATPEPARTSDPQVEAAGAQD